MKQNPSDSSAEPSKADSLRGFVSERLAAASREILAAVETLVSGYQEEASGLRLEVRRQRRQLQLLQNQVAGRTEDLLSALSHGSKGQDQSDSSSSDVRTPARPQISKGQRSVELSVHILKDSNIRSLSKNAVDKCPLVSLRCPPGLQGLDFLNLLRSAVPQLAGNDKPFEILTSTKRRRLGPLCLKTVTPEEISRNVRSSRLRKSTLYIRLKTQEEQTENSCVLLSCDEPNQHREERTAPQLHLHMETKVDGLMTSVSGEVSLAPSGVEGENEIVDVGEGDTGDTHGSDADEDESKGLTETDVDRRVWTKAENGSPGFSCKVVNAAAKSEVAPIKHTWTQKEEAGGVCGESEDVSKDGFQSEPRTDGCPDCGESSLGDLRLKERMKTPNHVCPTCHRVFDLKKQLQAHRRTPSACRTFLCGVCGKFLSSNRSLSRHKMTHSGERPHRCQVCGRSFKLATTLRQHEKIHTARERPYLCDVCCKMFLTSKQLVIHMRSHSNEKPYRCDRCGKGFTTRGPLTVHMRVHTGETPYRCAHCGWSFKRKTHLDDHVAIHTGAKPYVCGVCGKTCARRTYLTVHMRTHNGERPYKCALCERAFTQSHCLKTHMKSHKAAPSGS